MAKRNDGTMGLFIGITRSGKSTPIKAMIKSPVKAKRVLIWDAKNEYGPSLNITVIKSLPVLLDTLRTTTGNGRFAYVPSSFDKKEFDGFCRLAHVWNRQRPAVIVIEELAAVTNTGKAAGYWGVLVNQSLGLGATLLATVQRGQEVDKSVMNAASYLYVCQHNTHDDATYMAKKLGVELRDIPREPLRFMMWSPAKGHLASGHVTFKQMGQPTAKTSQPVFTATAPVRRQLKISATTGLFTHLNHR